MRLFGTDGIRGVANRDLTPDLLFRLGRVVGEEAMEHGEPRVLVGRDTRVSGEMLSAALQAGLMSSGASIIDVGIVPTPAVAYLTHHFGVHAGAMISASHNPIEDNGIKFFSSLGLKLPDEEEDRMERLLVQVEQLPRPEGLGVGRYESWLEKGREAYISHLAQTSTSHLVGEIVVDLAYGAATTVATDLFFKLGISLHVLHGEADGSRINVDCGATNPTVLQKEVLRRGAMAGFAYDGDADRVIAVDERGQVVNGDGILGILASAWHKAGRLPNHRIAATVMSNLGLKLALAQEGITMAETAVGDRYVLEAMLKEDLLLGGEQSGHVICKQFATTGDGLLTTIQLLNVMQATQTPLSELAAFMTPVPQKLINVHVKNKSFTDHEAIQAAIADAKDQLGAVGRIVVRPSGTEPLIRVMVEGVAADQVVATAEKVASVIQQHLGGA